MGCILSSDSNRFASMVDCVEIVFSEGTNGVLFETSVSLDDDSSEIMIVDVVNRIDSLVS